MTNHQTLLARFCLSIITSSICILAFASKRIQNLPGERFDVFVRAAHVISRLSLYVLVFFVLQIQPRGDVIGFYWPQALNVLHGKIPYLDFPSSYAPLHPFLGALLARVWPSPLVLVLFAILCESALLSLWLPLGRFFMREGQVRRAALFYLTAGISVQFVTIDGQNNVIVALLTGLAILLLQRNRHLLSGFFVGLAVSIVKFLPLVYIPVFFAASTKRSRYILGFVLGVVPIYAAFASRHIPIFSSLSTEGEIKSASNLPFLIESITGSEIPSRLLDAGLLIILCLILALVFRTVEISTPVIRLQVLVFAVAALTLAILFFAKKSWPPYLLLGLFPICATIPKGKVSVYLFSLFNIVAVTEPSVWASVMGLDSSSLIHARLVHYQPIAFEFVFLEMTLLAGYAWLLWNVVLGILEAVDVGLSHEELTHACDSSQI